MAGRDSRFDIGFTGHGTTVLPSLGFSSTDDPVSRRKEALEPVTR